MRARVLGAVGTLILGALTTIAVSSPAQASPYPSCEDTVRPGTSCEVDHVDLRLAPGQVAYLRAAAVVTDTSQEQINTTRHELDSGIHCYPLDARTSSPLLIVGAIRNVWAGVGRAGNYLRGVLDNVPSDGLVRCTIVVRTMTEAGSTAHPFAVSGYIAATVASAGVSSPGTNTDDPAPPATALLRPNVTVEVVRKQWNAVPVPPPAGAAGGASTSGQVHVTGQVNMTSCSFNVDRRPCADHISYNTGTPRLTVRLLAWQTVAQLSSTAACARAAASTVSVAIPPHLHHVTLPLDVDLPMSPSPACGQRVVTKILVTNTSAIHAYQLSDNTFVGAWTD